MKFLANVLAYFIAIVLIGQGSQLPGLLCNNAREDLKAPAFIAGIMLGSFLIVVGVGLIETNAEKED